MKAKNPKLTKSFKEYIDSDYRRCRSPRYIDFEFYKVEFAYVIHYIAEKDKVYSVLLDVVEFGALIEGVNLDRNPFGTKEDDMTPMCIWKMIAAYCRTYGLGMTKERAIERLQNVFFKEADGTMRQLKSEKISRDYLKTVTDMWTKRGLLAQRHAEQRET